MDYVIYIGNLIAIYATLAISLNLLVGYTGLISIAQAGVYGIGAYVTALLALNVTHDLLITMVLSAAAGGAPSCQNAESTPWYIASPWRRSKEQSS